METSREISLPRGRPRRTPVVFRAYPAKVFTRIADYERGPLGQQVYEFRMAVGMKRSVLARKMFTSDRLVFYWESGHHEPKKPMWAHFVRIRRNYRQKWRRQGKDLDGGPIMEDKS
jgi:DNA-binding transcriptional regulator YiaG